MDIRIACKDDFREIVGIYKYARNFMRENDNPNQWGDDYPADEVIALDILKNQCYLCMENGETAGVFAFIIGDEPTYGYIENGQWGSDGLYGTIHRLASNGRAKGVAKACFDFCKDRMGYLRADTHHDNIIMQSVLSKNGFKECGTIYVRDKSPRIAYEFMESDICI